MNRPHPFIRPDLQAIYDSYPQDDDEEEEE